MGNHQKKKLAAEAHNRRYGKRKGRSRQKPERSVSVGTIGHVDHRKANLRSALLWACSEAFNAESAQSGTTKEQQ